MGSKLNIALFCTNLYAALLKEWTNASNCFITFRSLLNPYDMVLLPWKYSFAASDAERAHNSEHRSTVIDGNIISLISRKLFIFYA